MILRHLFKTTRVSKANSFALRLNHNFFSNEQDKDVQDNSHINTEELLPQEDVQLDAEIVQQVASSEEGFQKLRNRNEKFGNRYKRYDRSDESDIPFVSSFLMLKKPEIDLSILGEENEVSLQEKWEELSEKIDAEIYAPLAAYESKLNLSVESLSKFKSAQPQNTLEAQLKYSKLGSYDENPAKLVKLLISSNKPEQLKNLYERQYFKNSFSFQLCQVIGEHVLSNPQDGYLLNILYQNMLAYNYSSKSPVVINKLNEIIQMARFGELSGANLLKFYWFTIINNPTLRPELSVNILREANKFYFNGVNLEQELTELSLFVFREKLCCKIIGQIISVTKSLEQFISIWGASLVLLARLNDITREHNTLPQKLNFNDILLFEDSRKSRKEVYQTFFTHNLPKILYSHADPQVFQAYQKALKFSQDNHKDQTSHTNHHSTKALLNLNFGKNLKIQYRSANDVFPLYYEFHPSESVAQKNWKSTESKIASAIARGQYKKALEYYQATLLTTEDEHIQFNRLLDKAKTQGFESEHLQALYMFRELARKFNYNFNPEVSLTPAMLQRSSRESRQFGDRRRERREYQPQKNEQIEKPDLNMKILQNSEKKSKGGFFGKPNSSNFSTSQKQDQPDQDTKQAQKKHYEEYLKVAKQTQEAANQLKSVPEAPQSIFNFKNCKIFGDVTKEFEKNINNITKQNLKDLLSAEKNIPIVDNIAVLIKYYFLKRTHENTNQSHDLIVSFNSSLGSIEKDYGQYLKGSYFPFAFTDKIYSEMLFDQSMKFNRMEFKKICAHLLCYNQQLSHQIVRQICDICSQQKIGITLLEIMHLVNKKRVKISYESLKTISSGIQKYKNMESDLVQFLKGYSQNTGISLETALFEQYIANLTYSEQYEKLNEFLETLKFELRAREYKIDEKLTPEQNIEAEAKHKKKEIERFNHQTFVMLQIISQNFRPRTNVPNFIPEMYQVYLGQKKGKFDSKDLGIGLLLNGRNQEQFLNTLIKIKENPSLNDEYVLRCGIRVLSIFSRRLKPHIEKVLNLTIYSRKAQLTNQNLITLGYVFKDVDMPNVLSEFLEYLLIIKLELTPEIKAQYYKIFNAITDDYSKNQISGLLDFIFNPKRQKEREEFRAIKEEQQKKSKLLQQMNKAKVEQIVKTEETGSPTREPKKEDKLSKKQKKKIKQEDKKEGINDVKPNTKTTLEDIKLTYTPKLSSYQMRNRPLRIFLGTFMRKYEPIIEGEDTNLEKGKQGAKGVKIKGDKKRS